MKKLCFFSSMSSGSKEKERVKIAFLLRNTNKIITFTVKAF
ncbi:hypothetical protein bcere0022_9620 [Bacillus cereus Rock3-44]|nr:hypothetical protein bcere0022_9620 [Bacillus cereus Rock3-44]